MDTKSYQEALRLHLLGWAILPVPHGWIEPRFEWAGYKTKQATAYQLKMWLGLDIGMGVVCGKISGGLVGIEFTAMGAYNHWRERNPELAQKLPTMHDPPIWTVFFRTEEATENALFALTSFTGNAGRIHGDGDLVVLPPTRHGDRCRLDPVEQDEGYQGVEVSGYSTSSGQGQYPNTPTPQYPNTSTPQYPNTSTPQYPNTSTPQYPNTSTPQYPNTPTPQYPDTPTPQYHAPKPLPEKRTWTVRPSHGIPVLTFNKAGLIRVEPDVLSREERFREGGALPVPGSRSSSVSGESSRSAPIHFARDSAMSVDGRWPGEAIQMARGMPDHRNPGFFAREADKYAHHFSPLPIYLEEPADRDLTWIVEGFLPETYLAVLGATSKSGKSCLVTALAMAVAAGGPFLGMPAKQGPVLWLAYEESRQERAIALQAFEERPDDFYICHDPLHIDNDQGLEALRWWVRKTQAKLLVIDPLYAAGTAESLSDGRSARQTLGGLKDLCRRERCAAIVLHHITKNVSLGMTRERISDSNQILAVASMDLLMDTEVKPDGSRLIWLQGRGRGDFANRNWLIESNSLADFRLVDQGTGCVPDSYLRDTAITTALANSETPMSAEDLAATLGQNVRTLRNRLTELTKLGRIAASGKSGHVALYAPAAPS